MRQLSFSYCFMRDLLFLNVDLYVELSIIGLLNDAAIHTINQLIVSLLKSKLAQIDHRCLLINIQRVDEFRAADRICTLVISDLNSLRRLCRCLFLQLDSNCAILFNLVLFEFFQKTSVPGNQILVTMKIVPKGRTFNSSSSVP